MVGTLIVESGPMDPPGCVMEEPFMISSPHFSKTAQTGQKDRHDPCEVTAFSDPLLCHHEIEQTIWRELQSIPGVQFSSLTVRRVPRGVCLQGVMEVAADSACADVCNLVKRIAHVENVVNQLVVCESARPVRFVPR